MRGVAAFALLFTAFSRPEALSATAEMAELPFLVCAADPGWTRPTREEMAATVWQDNRYRGADGGPHAGARAHYDGRIFVITSVSASGFHHLVNMAGFSGELPGGLGDCVSDPERRDALGTGREVEVWLVGYELAEAIADRDTLVVTLEPRESPDRGYQIVRIPRPDPTVLLLRFVLPTGELIAEAIGRSQYGPVDVPGWPPVSR